MVLVERRAAVVSPNHSRSSRQCHKLCRRRLIRVDASTWGNSSYCTVSLARSVCAPGGAMSTALISPSQSCLPPARDASQPEPVRGDMSSSRTDKTRPAQSPDPLATHRPFPIQPPPRLRRSPNRVLRHRISDASRDCKPMAVYGYDRINAVMTGHRECV